MGKITINELHNSLFDYAQAVSDENLITESKTVVGAINEIYGKKLIANAIGEPLNSTDTYAKMNNDINSLLSTFKTNMMNAGVVVESGDKFKQLIDKIKGLTEGEGNKGIQYAEGVIDIENITLGGGDWTTHELTYDIDFEPTILLICISKWGMSSSNKKDHILVICDKFSNSEDNATRFKVPNSTEDSLYCYITNTTSTGCTLNCYLESSTWDDIGGFSYCAIGVGEEDTTLRDSLADILQDEGVEVTPEDDMADLIVKVDEEFDRKNANSAKLDIICATELPNEVVNNQVVLITDVEPSIIKLTTVEKCNPTVEGEINISYNVKENPNSLYITQGNISAVLYLYQAKLYNNGTINILPAYIGVDNTWIDLNETLVILDAENRIANSEYFNKLTCTWSSWGTDEPDEKEDSSDYFNYNGVSSDTGILSFEGYVYGWYGDWYNNTLTAYLQSSFSIDTSLYSKLIVEAKTTLPSPQYGFNGNESSIELANVLIGFYSEGAGNMVKYLQLGNKTSDDYMTYELDISSLNTNYYFGLYVCEYVNEGHEGGAHVDIKRIKLVK